MQDIIHRDLKPENIMIQQLDDQLMARVLDFGIAKSGKLFDESLGGDLTGENAPGTLKYMSYEQLMNEEIDARTDIFFPLLDTL